MPGIIHWNASYMVANRFLTACGIVGVDFGCIRKGPRLADFEQKAWAIVHGSEHGIIWQELEIAPNSLKRLLYACNWISNYLWDCSCGFRVHWQGSEIGRFLAKTLGYSPWIQTWRILVNAGNRSKLSETPRTCLRDQTYAWRARERPLWVRGWKARTTFPVLSFWASFGLHFYVLYGRWPESSRRHRMDLMRSLYQRHSPYPPE